MTTGVALLVLGLGLALFVIMSLCIVLKHARDMWKIYQDGYEKRGQFLDEQRELMHRVMDHRNELMQRLYGGQSSQR